MWRRSVGGVTAVVLMGLVAGCGSDEGGGASATTSTALAPVTATAAATTTTVAATTTTLAQYYEIEAGDSLSGIAQKFDVRIEDLATLNEITDPDHIQVGDKLLIPPPTVLLNEVTTTLVASSSSP